MFMYGGEDVRYYKIINNGEITGYSETEADKSDCLDYVEIGEEEYHTAIRELREKAEAEAAEAEQRKDERIAELEAENAALLYQVLTGEELTDV